MANPNPKVSVEEMRAKRAQAESAHPQADKLHSGQNGEATVPSTEGATSVFIPPVVPAPPAPVPDINALLANLTPEQIERVRQLSISKGLAPANAMLLSHKLPDGSMTISVNLDPPVVEQLELWAEADGCSLVEEAQKRIAESLQNYLYGDWSTPEVAATAVPAAGAK